MAVLTSSGPRPAPNLDCFTRFYCLDAGDGASPFLYSRFRENKRAETAAFSMRRRSRPPPPPLALLEFARHNRQMVHSYLHFGEVDRRMSEVIGGKQMAGKRAKNKPKDVALPRQRSPLFRSRVSRGLDLLPDIDGRSHWARLMRDTLDALIAHCGGQDTISEPKRMMARRAACLETELIFLETKFATIRAEGGEPTLADGRDLRPPCRQSAPHRRGVGLGTQPERRDPRPVDLRRQLQPPHCVRGRRARGGRFVKIPKAQASPSQQQQMDILSACSDPQVFAPAFRDPSTWKAWRAYLAALFALPLSKDELEIYRQCTGRQDPPVDPARRVGSLQVGAEARASPSR